MANPKIVMKWVCSDCGSDQVQTKKWVDLNTDEPVSDCSDGDTSDNWCEGCESHTDVTQIKVNAKTGKEV